MKDLLLRISPYAISFLGAFLLTLVLTPIVRTINRRLGMVDRPGARRINTVAVPRGGGIAVVIGVLVSYAVFILVSGRQPMGGVGFSSEAFWRLMILSFAIAVLGLADDKFSLPPKLKLLGQLAIGVLVWIWAGLGFHNLWPSIPAWLDCLITVFWIAGAVNAFNLIDGLDGLASGLALIATIGMAGALFMINSASAAMFHFAFAGGLLAFLRYNYNPASIFLGDCGSMFIGFTLAVLPLASQTPNSFLVSVGVPLLAMGVPIFDTGLAIVRRSLRHIILKRNSDENVNGEVMTADSDHLHHRILREAKSNQRKAAWVLYLTALFFVIIGLVGMALRSRAAGIWTFAVAAASVVIFKDIARIELFDAGRLLNSVARDRTRQSRRKMARLSVQFLLLFDILVLIGIYFLCQWALRLPMGRMEFRLGLPIRVLSVFLCLVFFNAYRTVWSRAMSYNYICLLVACIFGTIFGSIAIYYTTGLSNAELKAVTIVYAATSSIALVVVRLARGLFRDIFYSIDCSRLRGRKDVSRILVYGSGLRYRAFRRELVRNVAANDRIIVGLIDDDILMRGQYIGGIRVLGTLLQAPEIINELNVDAVVVAFEVKPEWMPIIYETLKPTNVKITHFTFTEKELPPPPP